MNTNKQDIYTRGSRVFLGGTCADSTWRDKLIPMLKVPSFNPVVDDWTNEAQEEEKRQKLVCNIHLYVITSEMTGVFSISEATDSSREPGKRTILQVIPDGFEASQLKSLKAVCDVVEKNGGIAYFDSNLERAAKEIHIVSALENIYSIMPTEFRLRCELDVVLETMFANKVFRNAFLGSAGVMLEHTRTILAEIYGEQIRADIGGLEPISADDLY